MECLKGIYLSKQDMVVPCGKCPFCLATKRSDWALRLHYEGRCHLTKKFVTLTYADCHLHFKNGTAQLDKRDVQLWLKRVRRTGAKVRYFAVGEYGSKTYRPHYHVLLFGECSDDVIRDSWPLGHVHIGTVTGDSIAYTMKYIDKPNFKRSHGRDDREPEFPLMSKGLGADYLSSDVVSYHKADISRLYAVKDGGHRIALPRYYRQKIYSEDEQKQQVRLIQRVVIDEDAADRLHFSRLGYSPDYSFEQWKTSQAYGRYKSFYAQQLPRDL